MEELQGLTLKAVVNQLSALWLFAQGKNEEEAGKSEEESTHRIETLFANIGRSIGQTVAKLHNEDMVHGDLTTSNMMWLPAMAGEEDSLPASKEAIFTQLEEEGACITISLLDFGLGSVSLSVEDQAVDLLVLERPVVSSHPLVGDLLLPSVWLGYEEVSKSLLPNGKGNEVLSRLEEARMRGRKRECFG